MITNRYASTTSKKICLVVIGGPTRFEIQAGELTDSNTFVRDHTILVEKDRPNLLWDLLHSAIGIPYPQLESMKKAFPAKEKPLPAKSAATKSAAVKSSLEEELRKLNAKEIVKKIEAEKGIVVTNSLKSKKAIIAKAIKIYSENLNSFKNYKNQI